MFESRQRRILSSLLIGFLAVLILLLAACKESSTTVTVSQSEAELRTLLKVPDHFALPVIPEFNRPTQAKITLGRHLFYDKRLSANETQSCESCHLQAMAFADGVTLPAGSTGQRLFRNSQGLANAMYHASLTWANDGLPHLEDQLVIPLRSDNPIELGINENNIDEIVSRFETDPLYIQLFADAFPESEGGVTLNKIIFALASFCRTIISGNSAYDRFLQGDTGALTDQQLAGFRLFNGERFECFHCHSGTHFTTSYQDNNSDLASVQFQFFNNGLYNVDGEGSYPEIDQGLFDLTGDPRHRGFFRPQSLRNVALTAPYMHDGSIATLREVVEHYARGGRLIESGPNAGDGRTSPLKSGLISGFQATDDEIDAVVAFLESLSDQDLVTNHALSNPFN